MNPYECTFEQYWGDSNNQLGWYLSAYPWLKNISNYPPSFNDLQSFYIQDMNNRNLNPDKTISNCYYYLWSYFLSNYPIQGTAAQFQGRTFLQMSLDNLPGAINTSFQQIGTGIYKFVQNVTGTNIFIILALVVAGLYFYKK